jgi:RNA polymerase sigma factor (TIGR02999 family)
VDPTRLLHETTSGSPEASDRLLELLYEELHTRAERFLRRERPDHTLQATELVHEAYLKLVDQTRCEWQNRAHFLAIASVAMRRILVDHARRRGGAKRAGGAVKLPLEEALTVGKEDSDTTMLALNMALDKLNRRHPGIARVVEMRYFGGLTHDESACVLGVSPRTISRRWEFAQAWLYREMAGDGAAAC